MVGAFVVLWFIVRCRLLLRFAVVSVILAAAYLGLGSDVIAVILVVVRLVGLCFEYLFVLDLVAWIVGG